MRLVHALVTQCHEVTVLATSRERLGVPGEVAWSVPPLSLPSAGAAADEVHDSDAVAFFCERARAPRGLPSYLRAPIAPRLSGSAVVLMAFRWPWSWPPLGSRCLVRHSSLAAWLTGFGC